MKHLHIIEPYHSVAMKHLSESLADLSKLYEVTTDKDIDPNADCNLHIPWHTLTGKETGSSKHIIAYTHVNPPATFGLLDACERADLITAMSFQGRRELVSLGVDPKKIWVNYCAADQFKYRRRLIAIVGYPQPNGRKREHILLDIAWEYDLSRYEFIFVGAGWEDFANKLASMGVAVQAFHADTYDAINTLYGRVDALLVTGYVEGGPLPLLEAMVSGLKVFSPRFGYAADLLDEEDLYSGPDDLIEKLDGYFKKSETYHLLARSWKWQDYVAEYAMLIGGLLGESVDLYPERGTSRYVQLLDIIDEIRPAGIVEIGVWSGSRAIQMIQQAAKYRRIEEVLYQGFDLFEMQTQDDIRCELSKGGWIQDIVQRRLNATRAGVLLVAGYTKNTLPQYLNRADFYFVDGGHSEVTVRNDGEHVLSKLDGAAVAVFDDYYHSGKPEGMGCNSFIDSLDLSQFEITHLPARTKAKDGREIGMVKVRQNNANIHLQRRATYTSGGTLDGVQSFSVMPAMWPSDASPPAGDSS